MLENRESDCSQVKVSKAYIYFIHVAFATGQRPIQELTMGVNIFGSRGQTEI